MSVHGLRLSSVFPYGGTGDAGNHMLLSLSTRVSFCPRVHGWPGQGHCFAEPLNSLLRCEFGLPLVLVYA